MGKQVVLSGMRPTGKLHIGHLVGALENWVRLQDEYRCFFVIVDWHALTTDFRKARDISDNILEVALDWISVGIDPSKSTVFVQSQVKDHCELHLLLSMLTPMPWVERNPTLKEMVADYNLAGKISYGLMGYPVLQAADILIYKASRVPVGEDQVAHVEMAREIARRFNSYFGPVLVEPEELLTPTPRILGIDGKKMSKSLNNCIYLSDPPEEIETKVKKMITDPEKIYKNDPGNPFVCSVFDYHKLFDEAGTEEVRAGCVAGSLGCVEHKIDLAKKISQHLKPYREKREELASNKEKLVEILMSGAQEASRTTGKTMGEVREALGLW
ncbi:MAG: tryptophan--tRNA ligase [Candidatus Glassbacteria bacterium]